MSDIDAASFRIGFSTAWIGLVRRGVLQPGEWLLVLGADKLRFCEQLGADVVIDRNVRSVREAVTEATDGRGVDVIYDPVGGERPSCDGTRRS